MNFTQIMETCNKIRSISSTNEKKEFLASIIDEDFKNFLKWEFDSSIVSGLSDKKINKVLDDNMFDDGDWSTCDVKTIFDVFKYLENHKTGTDNDIKTVQWYRKQICKNDEEVEFFNRVVTRNLPLGFDVKILNKAIPNLVPTFEIMLANKFFDKPQLVDGTRSFTLSRKLDGNRCIAMKYGNDVRLISRQGKPIENCKEIESELKMLKGDFVLDCEILIHDRHRFESKVQFKKTMEIVSSKSDNKVGLDLNAFDYLEIDEFMNKKCVTKYSDRRIKLNALKGKCEHIVIVEELYVGNEINKIYEFLNKMIAEQEEGVMINFNDEVYQFRRSNALLKVKKMNELDAYIVGYTKGTNKYENTLGSLICEINHPTFGKLHFECGSGFSEWDRDYLYELGDDLIGRVVSIQYFEQTINEKTQVKSLRFPVFLELKEEGQEPNN